MVNRAKNVAVYIPRGGLNGVHNPTQADGTFDDIIRDLDYAASDLQVSVYNLMINNAKIPFTTKGFSLIESAIRASVLRSVNLGIFADDTAPIVLMPKVTDISANDRALRRLTGIKVIVRMAGAIHFVSINLTASI